MIILRRLWRDQGGFVSTTDLLLLATIVVLGSIVGLVAFRNQVVQEFGDLATAIDSLNQSYTYTGDGDSEPDGEPDPGREDCFVAGSTYTDETDFPNEGDPPNNEPAGIDVDAPPVDEGS